MRILLVHNAYQQRGGEDSVVAAELELLVSRGHEVRTLSRHNDEVAQTGKAKLASETLWSQTSVQQLRALVADWRPDIVHVHNTFPLISPSIYWEGARLQIPVVQTLHNFRLMCPQAMFLRNGQVCEDCLGHSTWRAVTRGCYRESRTQSAVLTGMLALHRALGTYRHKVTRYIALNEFCRAKFIEGGLPAHKVVVKPNFVDFPPPPRTERRDILFVGRLSKEKGVATLATAAGRVPQVGLRIAGTGPDASAFDALTHARMLGALAGNDVRREMENAQALVLPSIWYENFPRTLVEAFAAGLPVIASRLGALPELVEDGVTGLLFDPGNPADLADRLLWAHTHPDAMAQMGARARAHYDAHFTADQNYSQLMAIYEDAIAEVAGQPVAA